MPMRGIDIKVRSENRQALADSASRLPASRPPAVWHAPAGSSPAAAPAADAPPPGSRSTPPSDASGSAFKYSNRSARSASSPCGLAEGDGILGWNRCHAPRCQPRGRFGASRRGRSPDRAPARARGSARHTSAGGSRISSSDPRNFSANLSQSTCAKSGGAFRDHLLHLARQRCPLPHQPQFGMNEALVFLSHASQVVPESLMDLLGLALHAPVRNRRAEL